MFTLFVSTLYADQNSDKGSLPSLSEDVSKIKKHDLYDQIRLGVVMIDVKAPFTGEPVGWWGAEDASWVATGFILDKERGIIVTNKHVVGENAVATYELKFASGETTEAKLLYDDPFYDFAFLQVPPDQIPKSAKSLEFSPDPLQINKPIYGIGNLHGDNFSIIKGTIISLYENIGPFAEQSIKFSGIGITVGGASGSAVVGEDIKLKGIIYGGRFISGLFLPISYIKDAYESLKEGRTPKRKTTGVVVRYANIREAKELGLIPQKAFDTYIDKFKDAHNNIIMINYIKEGYPAYALLKPDDIFWSLNGELLGPRLYHFEKIINESNSIDLEVYRNGELKKITIKCDDLPNTKRKLISFSGATFAEKSIDGQFLLNVQSNAVFMTKFKETSGFKKIEKGSIIKKINDYEVKDLNALRLIVPKIRNQKFLKVHYVMSKPDIVFGDQIKKDTYEHVAFIKHEGEFDTPKYFEFDNEKHKWRAEELEEGDKGSGSVKKIESVSPEMSSKKDLKACEEKNMQTQSKSPCVLNSGGQTTEETKATKCEEAKKQNENRSLEVLENKAELKPSDIEVKKSSEVELASQNEQQVDERSVTEQNKASEIERSSGEEKGPPIANEMDSATKKIEDKKQDSHSEGSEPAERRTPIEVKENRKMLERMKDMMKKIMHKMGIATSE